MRKCAKCEKGREIHWDVIGIFLLISPRALNSIFHFLDQNGQDMYIQIHPIDPECHKITAVLKIIKSSKNEAFLKKIQFFKYRQLFPRKLIPKWQNYGIFSTKRRFLTVKWIFFQKPWKSIRFWLKSYFFWKIDDTFVISRRKNPAIDRRILLHSL